METSMREAAIQEFFTESKISPLTIVYEDFIRNYEETIMKILKYLDIQYDSNLELKEPYYEKLADKISEEWCKRFIFELQKDWKYKGWWISN